MIVLIVIAAVIAVIVFILNIPVSAYIRYYGGKPDIRVTFAFVQLFPKKQKKNKSNKPPGKSPKAVRSGSEKKKKPDKPHENKSIPQKTDEKLSDNSTESKENEKTENDGKKSSLSVNPLEKLSAFLDDLSEKKNAVQLLAELVMGPLKRLCGKIRIDDLKIDFAAADDDAFNAAILYGKANAAVYNTLSTVRCFVPVSVVRIRIDCLFNTPADKCRWDGEFKVKLRPASLVNAILAVLFCYIKEKSKYAPVMGLINK